MNVLKFSKPKRHYDFDTVFDFGKYKGQTVQRILDADPEYLVWCAEEISWFDLDTEVLFAAQMDVHQKYWWDDPNDYLAD